MRCCGLKTGLTNPVALNSVAADLLISAVSAEDWLAAVGYDPEVCLKNYMAYSRSLSLRGRSHQPLQRLQGDPIPDGRIDSSRESANRQAVAHTGLPELCTTMLRWVSLARDGIERVLKRTAASGRSCRKLPHVGDAAGECGGGSRLRAHEMGAHLRSLAVLEVAVGGRDAALARRA